VRAGPDTNGRAVRKGIAAMHFSARRNLGEPYVGSQSDPMPRHGLPEAAVDLMQEADRGPIRRTRSLADVSECLIQ